MTKGPDHQACNYPQGSKITDIETQDSDLTEVLILYFTKNKIVHLFLLILLLTLG